MLVLSSAAESEDDPADAADFNPFVLRKGVADDDEGVQEQAEVGVQNIFVFVRWSKSGLS